MSKILFINKILSKVDLRSIYGQHHKDSRLLFGSIQSSLYKSGTIFLTEELNNFECSLLGISNTCIFSINLNKFTFVESTEY